MPLPRTKVEISGPEHQGKTTLAVLIARLLQDCGAIVTLQRADPQIDEKISKPHAELVERVNGLEILVTELQTR